MRVGDYVHVNSLPKALAGRFEVPLVARVIGVRPDRPLHTCLQINQEKKWLNNKRLARAVWPRAEVPLARLEGDKEILDKYVEQMALYWPLLFKFDREDALGELLGISQSYDLVKYSADDGKFRFEFVTKPITLEGIELGRIRVFVELTPQPSTLSSRIWAEPLEANPPACDEEVFHPHATHNDICLGDSKDDFVDLLKAHQFCAAADLINAVLHTYNDGSVMTVPLEEWEGRHCGNCDSVVTDDTPSGSCSECGEDWCEDCDTTSCCGRYCGDIAHTGCSDDRRCEGCNEYVCGGCAYELDDGRYCGHCSKKCEGCRERFPTNLLDEDGRCSECSGVLCDHCQGRFPEDEVDGGYCNDCRETECDECGELFNRDSLTDGLCELCLDDGEEVAEAATGKEKASA